MGLTEKRLQVEFMPVYNIATSDELYLHQEPRIRALMLYTPYVERISLSWG